MSTKESRVRTEHPKVITNRTGAMLKSLRSSEPQLPKAARCTDLDQNVPTSCSLHAIAQYLHFPDCLRGSLTASELQAPPSPPLSPTLSELLTRSETNLLPSESSGV